MVAKCYRYALLGLTCFCVTALGRPPLLTLNKLLKITRLHYPVIQSAEQNIILAQGNRQLTKGAFDPALHSHMLATPSGGYENIYNDNTLSIPIVHGGAEAYMQYRIGQGSWPIYEQNYLTNSGGDVELGFILPLLKDFKIDPKRAAYRSAAIKIAMEKQRTEQIRIDSLLEAGIAYWNWVEQAKRLQLVRHLLDLAEFRQKALLRKFQLGDLANIDVVENKRFIMQRRAILRLTELHYKQAAIFLSLYYRDVHGKPVVPRLSQVPRRLPYIKPHNRDLLKYITLSHQIIANHPALLVLQRRIAMEKIYLKLANNQLLPKFNARASVGKEFGTDGDPRLRQTAYYVGFNFAIPFPRNQAKGQYLMAKSRLRKLYLDKYFTSQRLNADLERILFTIKNDRQQVFILRQEAKLSKKVEDAEIIKFRQGDSSLFLVNQREQTTFSAQLDVLAVEMAYYKSLLQLRAICAFKF